ETLRMANIHWRPQVDFLVYETYSKVFALEAFHMAGKTLKAKIGLMVHDARKLTGHGTDAVTLVRTGSFADTPLAELSAMKRAGTLPAHAQLYDADLAHQAADLYAEDMALYAAHLNVKNLTFSELL
ncbi:MAG: hypothetical protein AAFY55_18790, partial [Bacteroidota bacterium]